MTMCVSRLFLRPAAAVLLAALLGPGAVRADPAALPTSPTAGALATTATTAASPRSFHRLGFSLDAGIPGGAAATLLYRPWPYVRLGGSFLYNTVGYGVGASVSVAPRYWIAPSLTLEGGHYFEANALSRVRSYTSVSDAVAPWLEHAGYTYASAQLGLELGAPNTFVFYIRAGLSRVWLDVHSASGGVSGSSDGGAYVSYAADPDTAKLGLPAAKVGFALFFL